MDWLAHFPGATRDKPRFMALAGAVLRQVNDLLPLIAQLQSGFCFETAEGKQLDQVAAAIGLSRKDTVEGPACPDETFRAYIRTKLALWNWDGTNTGAMRMLENVLQGDTETDNGNGTVTVISEGNLPAEVGKLFPVPAGVRIVTETEESE